MNDALERDRMLLDAQLKREEMAMKRDAQIEVARMRPQEDEQAQAMEQAQMLAWAAQPAAQGAQAVKTMVEAQTMAEAGA